MRLINASYCHKPFLYFLQTTFKIYEVLQDVIKQQEGKLDSIIVNAMTKVSKAIDPASK